MDDFSHFSETGEPVMVDISDKEATLRNARAGGFVSLRKETIDLIKNKMLPKGDIFQIAKIAGIMAGKRTSEMIPLCHPLALSYIDVTVIVDEERGGVSIESDVRLMGKTGAEMEALTAVSVAALTVYDMCKAVDKEIVIGDIKLLEKRGGKSDFSIEKD